MRTWLRAHLARAYRALTPRPDPALLREIKTLRNELMGEDAIRQRNMRESIELELERQEAHAMAGVGPWIPETRGGAVPKRVDESVKALKESNIPVGAIGAGGLINLELENLVWRREANLSLIEFSRWGIQNIILICRLFYIKDAVMRRLIDVSAAYVFARGVEVSSSDDTANEILKDFWAANKQVFGQSALIDLERRKYYDGNIFFAFFPDTESTGTVKARTIDATEIQDIICDPNDADTPWFYKRIWGHSEFDYQNGITATETLTCWYPALNYDPIDKPDMINGAEVKWDVPVYHRKCGRVSKWKFGCPRAYPALQWCRTISRFLNSTATVKQALAQIALTITTKGGQQAIEGIKQQMGTTVGPASNLLDMNPSAVPGSVFASGPGTELSAFKTQGAGNNPEEVRQFKLQAAMVFGVPETFLSEVSTGNLATATTLDRPTELNFLEKQEEWREDFLTIATYVLQVSGGAVSGRLLEARKEAEGSTVVREAKRRYLPSGRFVYEAKKADAKDIEVTVTFPAILEGDVPAQVKAVVEAMTLDNKGGQVVGIDEKAGVRKLYDLLDIENGDEITESQYPDNYDPDRTTELLPQAIGKAEPDPGGVPQNPGGKQVAAPTQTPPSAKAVEGALRNVARALKIWEKGDAANA